LVAVFEDVLSLFENDKAAATKLMSSPVRGLGSRCPLDMLGTIVEVHILICCTSSCASDAADGGWEIKPPIFDSGRLQAT
jgi:hypothetical protein